MNDLTLFSTAGCHLCEEAAAILHEIAVNTRYVDIANDDDLLERYAIRIPVLLRSDGVELGWPFTVEDVVRFLTNV